MFVTALCWLLCGQARLCWARQQIQDGKRKKAGKTRARHCATSRTEPASFSTARVFYQQTLICQNASVLLKPLISLSLIKVFCSHLRSKEGAGRRQRRRARISPPHPSGGCEHPKPSSGQPREHSQAVRRDVQMAQGLFSSCLV